MFDKAIIDTDKFMDLGMTSKALYFLLGMEADDEGFVSYKKVMRVHGGNEDDIKVLTAKGFIIMFESGVVVITDWNKNNYLQRKKTTEYQHEKQMILLTEDKTYEFNRCLTSREEKRGVEKSITTKVVEETLEEFNYEDYLNTMKEDNNKAIQLIRVFFMEKGLKFKTKKEVQFAITRNIKEANTLMKTFEIDDVIEAIEFVKDKYPDIWTLETLSKYLINHRVTK